MKKIGTKRTFHDLLDENVEKVLEHEIIVEIPLDKIISNPKQPRTYFDPKALDDLANSIKEHGVLQPVIVKPFNDQYILVAGERRCKASRRIGLKTIPAIARDYNNKYLSELAILENVQREDLTPIEEALAYQKAIMDLHITQAELGRKIGKSRSYITNILGMLSLPEVVIDMINCGDISSGHARILSKLEKQERVIELAKLIVENKLTVREIEFITKDDKKRNNIRRKESTLTKEDILYGEHMLHKSMNKSKSIKITQNKIIISFKEKEEYYHILSRIKGDDQ